MKTALLMLLFGLSLCADKLEIRLGRELGRPSGVILRGPAASAALSFTLPRNRPAESASLALRLRHSTSLMDGSSLLVAVNGTPIHSVNLNPGNAGEIAIDAQIPAEILGDYNSIEFQAALHDSAAQCESPTDPALWVAVAATSRLIFHIGGYARPPKPEDFPLPLADPLDYRRASVRFVLTPAHSSADYGLAAHLAGALGHRLEYKTMEIAAVAQFDRLAEANQVLIGTAAELAEITGVSAPPLETDQGRLRVVESPALPGRYWLLIEGRDAVARQRATEAIPALIEEPRPRALLPERESFVLSDLAAALPDDASGPGITVRGADPAAIAIPLRPGAREHFVRAEQTVRFEYAYSPHVDTGSSALEVRLNGKTLAGRALERPSGSASEAVEVTLPSEALGEDNRLELRFHLFPKNAGSCLTPGTGSSSGPLWATLLNSSSFHLPRDSYADLPDLGMLRGGGFPLRDAAAIWVVHPQDATLFLNAAFLLGRLSGAAPTEVRFETEMTAELRRDAHLIVVVAEGDSLALTEDISPWNPQRVLLTIRGSGASAALLQSPLLIARLAGSVTTIDGDDRVRIARPRKTLRFGAIPLNRRVKYWMMDNMLWLMADSIASLFAGFFFLRHMRKHYFAPLPDPD